MSKIQLEIRKAGKTKSEILYESEGGIGIFVLLFRSYHYDFHKKIYYFETTVKEALNNITKLEDTIKKYRMEDSEYDDWSLATLSNIQTLCQTMRTLLSDYADMDRLISDYIMTIINYTMESSVKKPWEVILDEQYWILNLVQGNLNGKYLSIEEEDQWKSYKKDFLDEIEGKVSYSFCSACRPTTILSVGDYRLFRFSIEFPIKKGEEKLETEGVLYPILPIIQKYQFGYERISPEKIQDGIMEIEFYYIKEKGAF